LFLIFKKDSMHKNIINLFILLLTFSFNSLAQDLTKDNFQALAVQETTAMKTALKLRDGQADSVLNVHTQFYQSLANLSKNADITQRKTDIDKQVQQRQTALQKILSAIQWDQYEQDMQAKKAAMQKAIDDRRRKKGQSQQSKSSRKTTAN
jgi:hypothetical protein